MTTLSPPRPRRRPDPTPRDQQIYIDYQVTGKRQTELAADYHLTQCRISQIIRRVEAWRRQSDARAAGQPASRQQQQEFDRTLERARLSFIAREALRRFHDEQKTVTKKTGTRGDHAIDETTERIAPPNVQFLKVALQANRQLCQLEKNSPAQLDEPAATDDDPAKPAPSATDDHSVPSRDIYQRIFGDHPCEPQPLPPDETSATSFPGSSQGTHFPEAPASQIAPSTSHDGPPTPHHSALASLTSPVRSSTSPSAQESPQPQPPPPLPIEIPKSDIQNPALARRLLHHQKLHSLREARRLNLPHDFYFDAADGPLPPPPEYILDGAP